MLMLLIKRNSAKARRSVRGFSAWAMRAPICAVTTLGEKIKTVAGMLTKPAENGGSYG